MHGYLQKSRQNIFARPAKHVNNKVVNVKTKKYSDNSKILRSSKIFLKTLGLNLCKIDQFGCITSFFVNSNVIVVIKFLMCYNILVKLKYVVVHCDVNIHKSYRGCDRCMGR